MKKALSVYLILLLLVYGGLRYLGSKDASKNTYATETRFWKAKALSQKIVVNPESTPPPLFEKSRKRFEGIIKDYPGNPTLIKESNLSIAGLLIFEKKYQEGRNFLTKIRKDFPDDKAFNARSQFLVGFSYEKEGHWEAALKEYRLLRDRYPESQLGLEIPLYIARHDLKTDSKKGSESYEAAADYYRRLIQEHPKKPLQFLAMSYLLGGYEEQKKWEKALEVLKEIILTYPRMSRMYFPRIDAYSLRLKQPEKGIAIYESFIQSYPDHKDVALFKKRIERLKSSRRTQKNVS
ncbi:MAG: tetratricopeptide repeat protein [Candidatus Omnitrophica bacterium]|nr:tetratricopeptide repeat protein [Candidatus Omnitrophota bacterium]